MLPDSVEYIENGAFRGSRFESVRLPAGLKHLGKEAFLGCDKLRSISIPPSVRLVMNETFRDYSELRSVELSPDTTFIGDMAFYYCIRLNQINLGRSLVSIGASAFEECLSLKEVQIPGTTRAICTRAFYRAGLKNVRIPMSVVSVGVWAFRCNFLNNAYVYPQTRIHNSAFYPNTKVTVLSDMPKEEGGGVLGRLKKLFRQMGHVRGAIGEGGALP